MNQIVLIIIAFITSSAAQLLLKRSASELKFTKEWFVFVIISGLFYFASFVLYAFILKHFDLNKISPILTVGTMVLIVISSTLIFKESMSLTHLLGIILAVVSIFLLSANSNAGQPL